jgi:hypothetical protein
LFSSLFFRNSIILLLAGGGSLLLAGCGPRRVRADFTNYENSYAVTSNRELLLNLARLEQHDPTYFFKLGQISSSYRMEAALTGAGNVSTVSSPPATTVPTGSGSPTLLYENDPSFTLIPVNDDTNANILLRPVSAEVFYSLYLQGWRLDQLLRLTVNRVELTLPAPDPAHPGKSSCKVVVIHNVPPPWFDAAGNYANDGPQLASYITFLRVSAVIYALQKHGLLLLRGTNTFEPLDRASYIPNPTSKGGQPSDKQKTTTTINAQGNVGKTPVNLSVSSDSPPPAGGDAAPKNPSAPAAKDFDDAAAKSQVWELLPIPDDKTKDQGKTPDDKTKDQGWYLGANSIEPQFQLTAHPGLGAAAGYVPENSDDYGQSVEKIKDLLEQDFAQEGNGMEELKGGPDITEILELLYNGFSIEESSADQESEKDLCTGAQSNRISAHLVMRSLIGLMAAAAQEQDSFDPMMNNSHTVPNDSANLILSFYSAVHLATTGRPPDQQEMAAKEGTLAPLKGAPLSAVIPKIEQLPILKLIWRDGELANAQDTKAQLSELGLDLKYKGQDFSVADPKPVSSPDSAFVPLNTYWNRDMFRLINELSSQVSVDISKFPLPEVLQLRTE